MEVLLKVAQQKINLKNQRVSDKESNDIVVENCRESSFQEGLFWIDT